MPAIAINLSKLMYELLTEVGKRKHLTPAECARLMVEDAIKETIGPDWWPKEHKDDQEGTGQSPC